MAYDRYDNYSYNSYENKPGEGYFSQSEGKNKKKPLGRIAWIDALRGLTVISMVLYHLTWDLVYMYGVSLPWYRSQPGYIWQQSICWTFIIISGFSFSYGRHPLKRGLVVFGAGAAISAVTLYLMPEFVICFGVLTLLGSAMLIAFLLNPVLKIIPSLIGLPVFGFLFAFTRHINEGYIGFSSSPINLPGSLYSNYVTAFFGCPPENFFSTDYFSLLPWLFLFLCGFYLQKVYVKIVPEDFSRGFKVPGLWYLGRDALFIYIFHQPVIYGFLYILNKYGVI